MKKLKLLGISILLVGVLTACGEAATTEEESAKGQAEETSDEAAEEEAEESDAEEGVIELNQEIADNDSFKATLVSIERIYDETWDEEKIEVVFDVENKRDDTIEFQAREVSIDGRMVDEMLLTMSTEVASGKSAKAVLTIQDYEGGDLPELEEDFEMLLHVFSWDDYDFQEQAEVNVTFE
ncbi:hypothetical protein P4631_18240 [Halalkalibacterium halodurans]|uniref:BH3460 protein n=1 Tax=Halalkalibacterium halodurans (strain ATCC BAA-125 / DSM 18197 / FERM 7344 / JCM 9153 / C-125) TaxID=272558 RepID=Q9K7A7_HALH5|nr:hypothetical protein [Halalkalibacterium halodurans]MED4174349.1 hypothetical protein [Halalkalibacterium halodurans]BAB07179.1 BH3460 [Halalkalibacterium halodurans C-125]